MSAPLPRGAIVRHRLRAGLLGEVVRGPRRASRGMVWVVWEGASMPALTARLWVAYVARRGPMERVKSVLAELEAREDAISARAKAGVPAVVLVKEFGGDDHALTDALVRAAKRAAGAVLLAVLAGAGAATAQVQTLPGGGVTCPGGYTAQRLNGELVIVCPPPPMTPEQARQQREQAERIARDEAERLRRQSVENGACGPDVPAFRRSPNCP